MYMSKCEHIPQRRTASKRLGRGIRLDMHLKVAALVAADRDRECSLSRPAAKLYILVEHGHIISSAWPREIFYSQKVSTQCMKVILSICAALFTISRGKGRGSADFHAPAKINAMGNFVSGHAVLVGGVHTSTSTHTR